MFAKPGTIEKAKFRDIEQGYTWNNLVRGFDLRYWYMNQGINHGQGFKYCNEIEDLHNELNYAHTKGTFFFS